ncbi:hypothetical protein JG687_00018473 [Phytophthora cactorum]|uniref:Reverse transcriptase Ty1/copia-type domain-containing protein n=2 Tax=Phytophthora cactorum TaxID=29920 RepID=A0A8T1TQJ2_9STRA|nr:hypothetical protein JG687_00018473 [Phytophthora cactorum]
MQYGSREVQLPTNVPFVPIPIDGVRDHDHVRLRDLEDLSGELSDVEMEQEVPQPGEKGRRGDSSNSSSSEDYEFSGSWDEQLVGRGAVGGGAVAPVPQQPAQNGPQPAAKGAPQPPQHPAPGPHQPAKPAPRTGRRTRRPQQQQPGQQPVRHSQRQRRPNVRLSPSNWVLTVSIMQLREALASEHASQWQAAMNVEYESLIGNLTWELVPRPKSTKKKKVDILTSLWIIAVKRNEKGKIERFNARLALRGFL